MWLNIYMFELGTVVNPLTLLARGARKSPVRGDEPNEDGPERHGARTAALPFFLSPSHSPQRTQRDRPAVFECW